MTTVLWSVTCVSRREVQRAARKQHVVPNGLWKDLACEITLRLERTPSDEALRYEFATEELARRAAWGLRMHLRNGQMKSIRNRNILYVYRGKDYHKGA